MSITMDELAVFSNNWKDKFPDCDAPKEIVEIGKLCQVHSSNFEKTILSGPAALAKTSKIEAKLQKYLQKHRKEQQKAETIVEFLEKLEKILQATKGKDTDNRRSSIPEERSSSRIDDFRQRSISDVNAYNKRPSFDAEQPPILSRSQTISEDKTQSFENQSTTGNGSHSVIERKASSGSIKGEGLPPAVKPKPLFSKNMQKVFSKINNDKQPETTNDNDQLKQDSATKNPLLRRNQSAAENEFMSDLKRSLKSRSTEGRNSDNSGPLERNIVYDSKKPIFETNIDDDENLGSLKRSHVYEDLHERSTGTKGRQSAEEAFSIYEDVDDINNDISDMADDVEEGIYSSVNVYPDMRQSQTSDVSDVYDPELEVDRSPMLAASNTFTVYNTKLEDGIYDNVNEAVKRKESISTDDDTDDDELYSLYASLQMMSKKASIAQADPSMLYVDREQIRNRKEERQLSRKKPQTLHQRLSIDCSNLLPEDSDRCDSTESIDMLNSAMMRSAVLKSTEVDEDLYQDPDELECPDSVPATPNAESEKDDGTLDLRKIIVSQLHDSESQYLGCLSTLLQYRKSLEKSAVSSQPVITQEEINKIFFKLPELNKHHSKFAKELEEQLKDWCPNQVVGASIKEFVLYELDTVRSYVKNYPTAVSEIDRLCLENETFKNIAESVTIKGDREEKETLRDLLFKPVVRLQRNSLTLKDLLKQTSNAHPDRKELESSMKLIGNFLEEVDVFLPETGGHERAIGNERILVKNSLTVEQVHGSRKLRHMFLFSDVLVCAKPKQGKQNKCTFEVKWYIPLNETADMGDSLKSVAGDPDAWQTSGQVSNIWRQKSRHNSVDDDLEAKNKLEVENLRRKVKQYKRELKSELDREDPAAKEKVWSLVGSKVDRLRKRLIEAKCNLVLASPTLPFKITNKQGKVYTLLMTSDYERDEWREAIKSAQRKVCGLRPRRNFSAFEVQALINSCRQITVNNLGTILIQEGRDEEVVNGMLNVTIHKMVALKDSAATYCSLEVDSFGQFSVLARTNTIVGTKEPVWDQDFEIPLDCSQTLRVLCYQQTSGDQDNLLGRGAMELNKSWLPRNYKKYTISMQEVNVEVSVKYTTSSHTIKRHRSKLKSGLFGVSIGRVVAREKTDIPTIVSICTREIEQKGLDEVGIYRVSGVTSDIQTLKKLFDRNLTLGIKQLEQSDIHMVTGLIKLYFRELPESLFTDHLYVNFVQGQGLVDPAAKERAMLTLFKQLPEPNYSTALHLLRHLVVISSYEDINKMTLQNLAIVFGPTLLRPALPEAEDTSPLAMLSATKSMLSQSGILLTFLELMKAGKDFTRDDISRTCTKENLI